MSLEKRNRESPNEFDIVIQGRGSNGYLASLDRQAFSGAVK